jgi:transcriptional regulator with XRE-family HTH domain
MTTKNILDPKLLGFWARCVRDTQHISQEALAVSASVDVRTIQRFESGKQVNLTSRRCIARGLGYDNPDIFDDPAFAATVHDLFQQIGTMQKENLDKQHPDHIRVKVGKVMSGDELGRFADTANAVLLHADDELAEDAKDSTAAMFDYVRDLMDLDDVPYTDKRTYHKELETMLRDIEEQGLVVYSAFRNVKTTNDSWVDKTPIPMTIGYLTVVPASKQLSEISVPRRVS